MFLAIKTNEDPAEIYLLRENGDEIAKKIWDAGRTLAKNLLGELEKLLRESDKDFDAKKPFANISGIIIFQGPGSFTGLRIGITVANAIAYAQNVAIVGTNGENWLTKGLEKLREKQNDKIVLPEYGAAPHITQPKK